MNIDEDLKNKLISLCKILNDGEAFVELQKQVSLLGNDIKWIKNILKWIWIPITTAVIIDLIMGFFK
jgi:hypothetical protein